MKKEYFVEKILASNYFENEKKYLIKWQGFSIDKSTWEPEKNLEKFKPLLEHFEKTKIPLQSQNSIENCQFDKIGINPSDPPDSLKKRYKKKFKIKKLLNENTPLKNRSNINSIRDVSMTSSTDSQEEKVEVKYSSDLTTDIPICITKLRFLDKNICCLVEWQPRSNGITPKPSYIPADFLKQFYSDLILEFYEEKYVELMFEKIE